jgi:Asp-tRNA(Asn)/Glu-tRNA(Gln) amidotransferase A subunit family amidase
MTELAAWPALDVLAAFRAQTLSPVEYLQALLDRIDAVQPSVNALGDVYADAAMRSAAQSAERYAGKDGGPRPLDGLPVAVKDETEVAGRRTTNGSLLWQDYVSESDDPIVERLRAAGAYVHARTLTPEFSIPFWTHSRLWGVTRNPWNTSYDVGGSSGGSAAALAAGMTPLATGSDIGGSIRMPASCCGVVGFKPPHGRIAVAGLHGRDEWSCVGPLARTVRDAALLADAVSGAHPRDPMSLRQDMRVMPREGDLAGMRIAFSPDLGDWPVTDEVASTCESAAVALRERGAVVEHVTVAIPRALVRTASDAHYGHLFAADLDRTSSGRAGELNPYTRNWLAAIREAMPPFLLGREAEVEIGDRLGIVLAEYDALMCPAFAVPAFSAGTDHTVVPFTLDGVELDTFHDLGLAEVFNAVNRCPVLCVPAGRASSGVPIGVQVAGRTMDDPTVFRIGAALEAVRPWPLVARL